VNRAELITKLTELAYRTGNSSASEAFYAAATLAGEAVDDDVQKVDFGKDGVWTVAIRDGETTITDAAGVVRHRSKDHATTAVHFCMSIKARQDAEMVRQREPSRDGWHWVLPMIGEELPQWVFGAPRSVERHFGKWYFYVPSLGGGVFELDGRETMSIVVPRDLAQASDAAFGKTSQRDA